MKKIAMIGLRGSGKTCFTTAMTMAMNSGIKLDDGSVFNLSFADLQQMAPLMNAYMGMTNDRNWPPSSEEKISYDFNSSLSLRRVLSFTLLDYPGGYLTDPNHMDEMLHEFNECSSVIVLIGADMLRQFLHENLGLYPYFSMLQQFTQNVISEFDKEGSVFPPTIIAITKSDEFANEDEIKEAYSYLKDKFASIFGVGTNMVSGITHIQLGNNLKNNGSKIEGDLILKPSFGNLSIPILFSLYASAYTNRETTIIRRDNKIRDLSNAQKGLMKAQNENIFVRIRDRITGKRRSLEETVETLSRNVQGSNEQLSNLSKVIHSIESTLINGAELYYNGERIN